MKLLSLSLSRRSCHNSQEVNNGAHTLTGCVRESSHFIQDAVRIGQKSTHYTQTLTHPTQETNHHTPPYTNNTSSPHITGDFSVPRKLLPAFTLIEMMIVISIIGLLAGVAYPLSSLYFRQARDTQRESSLHQLVQAHHTYFTDHNSYPTRNPEPDRANCVSTDLTSGHPKYLPSLPTSPS